MTPLRFLPDWANYKELTSMVSSLRTKAAAAANGIHMFFHLLKLIFVYVPLLVLEKSISPLEICVFPRNVFTNGFFFYGL